MRVQQPQRHRAVKLHLSRLEPRSSLLPPRRDQFLSDLHVLKGLLRLRGLGARLLARLASRRLVR